MKTATHWDASNLAHRYTVSFFKWKYGDAPAFITASTERRNRELNYFNIADADNRTNATICAGLLVDYLEAQGIPYHADSGRKACFDALVPQLQGADNAVLSTADLVDHYFQFLGEPPVAEE